ncbi:MAG TPA: NHL repeat-containing protein [Solirubrobacteraceae bacterium]
MRAASLLLLALGSLLLCCAPALAGGTSFGGEGSGEGQFKEPAGVAVNETSDEVYVVDKGNDRVEIFSPEGAYLSQFDGSETPASSFSAPEGIAVDNSCVGGALECADESVLDVYVADTGHHVIDKFSPEGKYLGQLTGTGPLNSFSGKLGITVDSRGDVWVSEEDGSIYKFNNSKNNLFLEHVTVPFAVTPQIAVDSEEHVYVIDAEHDVNFEKEELPIGHRTEALPCHCATGIALDAATNDVYVDEGTSAGEYNRKGDRVGTPFGSGQLSDGTAIAFNAGHGPVFQTSGVGDAYVTDTSADLVWIFTHQSASVEACGGVQPVSGAETLCAVVNPNGESIEGCHFEFGEGSGYGNSFPCSPSPPYSAQTQIEASVSGLRAGTTYHYRVALTTKNGTILGPDEQFSTEPIEPSIESESASHITQHSASLEAKINPQGSETSYEIWFWPGCSEGACERVAPRVVAKAADIGSGHEGLVVSAQLTDLQAGISNNEYWVVASNSAGTTETAHQTFATPPAPSIQSESVSQVTQSDATLEATINPQGVPYGVDYQFQLVKNTSEYLGELICAEDGVVQPVGQDGCLDPPGWPSGAIPLRSIAGSEGKPVSLDLASVGVTLQPGTTYHYRVLAATAKASEDGVIWESPATIGADHTFTTNSSHARPLGGEGEPSPSGPPSSSSPGGSTGPGSPQSPAPSKTLKPKSLTRAQKLSRALKRCKKEPKHKRAACQKKARKSYGPLEKKNSTGK